MDENRDLFSTAEAAAYLGLSETGVKYHVKAGHLRPALVGKTLVFTRRQLDDFQLNRRPAGRPRKDH